MEKKISFLEQLRGLFATNVSNDIFKVLPQALWRGVNILLGAAFFD